MRVIRRTPTGELRDPQPGVAECVIRKDVIPVTDNTTIWRALQEHLPKKTWISLEEILTTVHTRLFLDEEDLKPARSHSGTPRWESNVRRLLRMKTQAGSVRSRRKR